MYAPQQTTYNAIPVASQAPFRETQQECSGSVFSYRMPLGWIPYDGGNFVRMQSPDGAMLAYTGVLSDDAPSTYDTVACLMNDLGYRNAQVVQSTSPIFGQDGFTYMCVEFLACYRGMQVRGRIMSGVPTMRGGAVKVSVVHAAIDRFWSCQGLLLGLLDRVRVRNTHCYAHLLAGREQGGRLSSVDPGMQGVSAVSAWGRSA